MNFIIDAFFCSIQLDFIVFLFLFSFSGMAHRYHVKWGPKNCTSLHSTLDYF